MYRNINLVDKFFGLELVDGCVLLFTFFAAFSVNREGLFGNGLVLLLVYLALRALKRGKPDGYMLVLCRHVLVSRFKRTAAFDACEAVGAYVWVVSNGGPGAGPIPGVRLTRKKSRK